MYYKALDGNRSALAEAYEHAKVLWNGTPYVGKDQIGTLLGSLPSSKHLVQTIDCQPSSFGGSIVSFLVIVNGVVEYDNNPSTKRIFTQYFTLCEVNNSYYIMNDVMRWVAPTNRTEKQN